MRDHAPARRVNPARGYGPNEPAPDLAASSSSNMSTKDSTSSS